MAEVLYGQKRRPSPVKLIYIQETWWELKIELIGDQGEEIFMEETDMGRTFGQKRHGNIYREKKQNTMGQQLPEALNGSLYDKSSDGCLMEMNRKAGGRGHEWKKVSWVIEDIKEPNSEEF